MKRKTRLIMFLAGLAIFLVLAPVVALYSVGYRIDFEQKKLVATGGIYVKAQPERVLVSLGSKKNYRTRLFSGAVLIKNLLPKNYNLTIAKEGYHSYQKEVEVKEKAVAKLEHVILFKKEPAFSPVASEIVWFFLSPDNANLLALKNSGVKTTVDFINLNSSKTASVELPVLLNKKPELIWQSDTQTALLKTGSIYFILKNEGQGNYSASRLTQLDGAKRAVFQGAQKILFLKNGQVRELLLQEPQKLGKFILANAMDFVVGEQNIFWLASDGSLYKISQSISGEISQKVSTEKITIQPNYDYQLSEFSGIIFLRENKKLYWLNTKSRVFESFYESVNNIKNSPNGEVLLIHNDKEILLGELSDTEKKIKFLNRFSEKVGQVFWLNNNYLVFVLTDKISIIETHSEGNINLISLPQKLKLTSGKNIKIENPSIYYNPQNKKLYVLTRGELLVSENLIP